MSGEQSTADHPSTFADQTFNARRTESVDAPIVKLLVNEKTNEQFGNVNLVHLIEKANLAVTLCNAKNEVLGFSAFLDYPQQDYKICDDFKWEEWIKTIKNDKIEGCTPINSLYMHYFVAHPDFPLSALTEMMRAVFSSIPQLYFVILLVKIDINLEPALESMFTKVQCFSSSGGEFNLLVTKRHDHFPTLHVRKAVVEDTDDLTPLFTRLDSLLTKSYGDFFISETIEAQDSNNQCLAAEVKGTAIGFMSICNKVNTKFLQESYELDVFHGLTKPHPDDEINKPKIDSDSSYDSEIQKHVLNSQCLLEDVVDFDKVPEVSEEPVFESKEMVFDELSVNDTKSNNKSNRRKIQNDESKMTNKDTLMLSKLAINSKSPRLSAELKSFRSSQGKQAEESIPDKSSSDKKSTKEISNSRNSSVKRKLSDGLSSNLHEPTPVIESTVLNPMYCSEVYKEKPLSESKYFGESNAFCIQLFCIEEQHETRSIDFLPKMFKLFPDKEYAIISLPHLVPEFPLLKNFVRVVPRLRANNPHELYVLHRDSLLTSKFSVRRATSNDQQQIEKFAECLSYKSVLLDDIRNYNETRLFQGVSEMGVFVAEFGSQVVGVCVLRREENLEYIRSHYNIEDFVYFNHHRRDEHSHLNHFVLNSVFQNYSKIFMKEVLRQSGTSCLYYPVYSSYEQYPANQHSLITGLSYMVPIRARRQICYPVEDLGSNRPSDRVLQKQPPYALNHINRKLTFEPKVVINARIVVVGASDVALSFLEILSFCPHLRFNNLVLVSKQGLPLGDFQMCSQTFSKEDLARMSLRTWVTQIKGMVIGMNRGHKQLLLEDGSRVPYDYLVMCAGQQFQIPAPTNVNFSKLTTNFDLSESQFNQVFDKNLQVPENVISLNDCQDYKHLIAWTKEHIELMEKNEEYKANFKPVVVYGNNLQSYSTVQLLLKNGLPGNLIKLVHPPLVGALVSADDDLGKCDVFNEPLVTQLVDRQLNLADVNVLGRHVLASFKTELNKATGRSVVTHASFSTDDKPLIDTPISAFISLHPLRVNYKTFHALNDSCMVFDGRLVIDANFNTNDPLVRAAGTLTKYSRKYHADGANFRHENQSSREIGFRLAMSMLPLLDPTLESVMNVGGDLSSKLVPLYHQPKVVKAKLPGGFTYLHVRKPGKRPRYEVDVDRSDHGLEMVTGKPHNGNYFRLHLNQFNCVETITCVVKSSDNMTSHLTDELNNLVELYGVHERYLNCLVQRWLDGLVDDLFAYFRQPWAMVVFHDRFSDFRQEIREIMASAPVGAKNLPSIEAMVHSLVDEDLVIDEGQRDLLSKHFEATGQRRQVEKRLLSFLNYNKYHLPMYAKPGMI